MISNYKFCYEFTYPKSVLHKVLTHMIFANCGAVNYV